MSNLNSVKRSFTDSFDRRKPEMAFIGVVRLEFGRPRGGGREMASKGSKGSKAAKRGLLWGVPAAADELGLDEKTVRRGIEEKTIPAMRIGRNYKIPLWWIRQQRDGLVPPKAP